MKFIATIISSIIILSSLTMVQADEKKQKNLEAVAKEIKAAVKAGKITEKEAKAKFAALKKQGHEKKEPGLAEWIKKIQTLVKSGELTKEEGAKKIAALKKKEAAAKKSKKTTSKIQENA